MNFYRKDTWAIRPLLLLDYFMWNIYFLHYSTQFGTEYFISCSQKASKRAILILNVFWLPSYLTVFVSVCLIFTCPDRENMIYLLVVIWYRIPLIDRILVLGRSLLLYPFWYQNLIPEILYFVMYSVHFFAQICEGKK